MRYDILPVKVCGFEMWRAVIRHTGTVVWEAYRWSEHEARALATWQIQKLQRAA